MLFIRDDVQIEEAELSWGYSCSGGPGGQNVNKVATKVLLRWNVRDTQALLDNVKSRLFQQQRKRITKEGELLLTSQRFRDQERNRQDCLDKLRRIVEKALIVPEPRKPTKPTRASKRRRLAAKRHRSQVKSSRRSPPEE